MDIITLISEKMPTFSKGQRAIAKYILESCEKSAFLTAGRLAKEVGISESTVVRFALELGYDGYPGMQKDLQELVLEKVTPAANKEAKQPAPTAQDTVMVQLSEDIRRIQKTMETLNLDAFYGAVDALCQAKRIYVIGAGPAGMVTELLASYLRYLFQDVIMVRGWGSDCEKLARISREDAAIVLSFSRHVKTITQCVQFCKSRGAGIVAIADSYKAPICQLADYCLPVCCDRETVLDSLTAPMSLIHGFVSAIAKRRKEAGMIDLSPFEDLWAQCEVYEEDGEGQ